MFVVRLNLLNSKPRNWQFQGKNSNTQTFGSFRRSLAVILFLGFALLGVCEDVPMVSMPLGFEISGFDGGQTYVSQNGVFAFGFFEGFQNLDDGDGDGDGFVVGIRYNLGDKAANVPVWTVGGGLGVSLNSTVKLSMDGRLILVENPNGFTAWSTDTSKLGVKKATLLNSGNLVLMDGRDRVVWESFSSPTNTVLPGQSLHFPQTLRAPSRKPITSYYSFVIRHSGELALVWEDNVTYWRTHFSSSSIIKEARFDSDGVLGLVEATNSTVWSASSEDFKDPYVFLRHLRIDLDGNLRIYSWETELHRWRVTWQAVENQCYVFGSCGLYSLCGFNSTGPVCDCLYQDSVSRRDGLPTVDSGGFGCRKMVDLGNCKMNTSMVKLEHTVLYGLYPPQDVDVMLSEQACKDHCSNDSSCIAVTSKNDGSGLCTIKRTDFISGYRNPSVCATSFLKVCLVPQAVSAQGVDPHGNFMQSSIYPRPFENQAGYRMNGIGAIAFIVFVTVFGFLTMEMFVFWFLYRRRQIDAHTRVLFRKDAQMNPHYSALIRLSYEEIKVLTRNFTNQLGPAVYKGVLPNNTPVAAKVLNGVIATEKDFRVAVSTLGIMHHRNLVPLKGFCFEQKYKLLLYEYVPNGSLDKWLLNRKPDEMEMNWQHRLNIALGVARALAYLHLECQRCIPHGNLKLQNILLDEKLLPKLTDFGLQSLLLKESASSSESPSERDIYMLGEILHHLVDNMNEKLEAQGNKESEGVERVVRIALWCMQNEPFRRPSIGEVVQVLEGTFSVERPPSAVARRQEQRDEEVAAEIQIHTFNKACAAVYPTTVQHDIVWFWPNTDPQYKDIILKKKPPNIPELDDPSFTRLMGNRDIPYGYEVLIENLMDPAHVPYAHYGLMRTKKPSVQLDREGGRPVEMAVKKLDINGFIGTQEWGGSKFISPCIFYAYTDPIVDQGNGSPASAGTNKVVTPRQRRAALIFLCVPVSPGNSRLIWAFPRNFGVWIDKLVPRWMFHVGQNLILDSDLYLLHIEEHKIMDVGQANWQKACFVPTKSDTFVVGFRRWLNKYAGGEVDWKGKYSRALPPTPPKDQLMDRYWSHVVNCTSCRSAYKSLNALEVILQVISLVSIGVVAAMKQNVMSAVVRVGLVSLAVLCFAASRWLAHFIYKNFHYHDYNHALR